MPKALRVLILLLLGIVVLALVVGAGLYFASQRAPQFYEEALAFEGPAAEEASQEMIEQASALVEDVKDHGEWDAIFTSDQINGWLAVDRTQNHPNLLPPELEDPRVAIEPTSATIACRYQTQGISTILSLDADIYLERPNTVAIRLRGAWAGAVPMPMGDLVETLQTWARDNNVPLEWRMEEDDPVAVLVIPPEGDGRKGQLFVEKVELRSGEIYLAGRTLPSRR